MINFIEYVVSELKSKRLSKINALALIKQFSFQSLNTTTASVLHPLLHTNTSDLSQQSYSSTFTGEEFFLADHQVNTQGNAKQKILPGVAYLEMARAAVEQALPAQTESMMLELRNVVWLQPIMVVEPREITIALFASDTNAEQIDYEIYSQEENFEALSIEERFHETIHCQGQAVFSSRQALAKLDIAQLKEKMQQGQLNPHNIYAAFAAMGLNYGPTHQGIAALYQGEKQLIAQLHLPAAVATNDAGDKYLLHPSLMDSALQASIGFIGDLSQLPSQPSVPFALESVRIISACTKNMFAWVRYSPGSEPEDKISKLDIDLCDEDGNICVQMRGFTSRVLSKDSNAIRALSSAKSQATLGSLIAAPVWESAPISSAQLNNSDAIQQHIILCEVTGVNAEQLETFMRGTNPQSHCLTLPAAPQKNIAERYTEVALACFELIQKILKDKSKGKVLVQIVVPNHQEQKIFAGIAGLVKTAALENPQFNGQIILTNPEISTTELAAQLQENQSRPRDTFVKYEQGARQLLTWQSIAAPQDSPRIAFKDQGVYLITGGLGGLGTLFAQEILKQTTNAKIIFTGRSTLTAEKQAILDKLSAQLSQSGSAVLDYEILDIANLEQVKQLLSTISNKYHQLNGIIHSAGMTADNFILKKTSAEFSQVLTPKVAGTFNLDEASQNIDLDFLVLFSSGVSVMGNNGQADYAAANGFMDQFADYRNQLVAAGQRLGRTLSINWPLWQAGGMSIDPVSLEMLFQATGMQPMQTATGLEAFYRSLALSQDQTLVMEGNLPQMQQILSGQVIEPKPVQKLIEQPPVAPALSTKLLLPADTSTEVDAVSLLAKTQDYLKKEFSALLKLPSHKIDAQAPLENYGIDSILAMNLTGQLEKTFGPLSKTLFFEYQTIRELTDYLLKSHSEQIASLFATTNSSSQATAVVTPLEIQSETLPKPLAKFVPGRRASRQRHFAVANTAVGSASLRLNAEPIAIVGLSGRYPESVNIEDYWRNLRDGKDCVVEVPKDRWDWQEYFTEDRSKPGYHYSKWGGFIAGVDEFDPLFFNISPREAKLIDPQERLFLQHAWMAIEDAGYTRASLQVPREKDLAGQVGVYVGVMYGEYNLSGSLASIANRTSYVLNLHGPSMTLDTMCSSSLTAIHLACQDLKLGRTDLAIAGGVNVSIHPSKYLMLSAGQFISGDGHCQSFGEGGDGYIPGEGVGAVILKRLSEAKQAGNHIYGIIRGSALNHGGKTNGYTVPNPQAQASAISLALAESKTNPRHVSYIEAHGTGTKLGDPIEIAALNKAFYQYDQQSSSAPEFGFCALGSAKSNIGHCESAAGIAGLTKILLQMKHQQIVPSLHSTQLNPHIDFAKSPFVVNQSLRAWEQPLVDGRQLPRIAGLSSFGAGGANAHIIIEEYLSAEVAPEGVSEVIVPLSARTPEQLKQKARDLLGFIHSAKEQTAQPAKTIDLHALAYTLQVGREAMEERLGFMVSSVEQLAEKLQAYVNAEQNIADIYQGQVKSNKDTLSLFTEDTELQETIGKWIARKKLPKLLDLWVKGLELDWSKLYTGVHPQLISLPTYPFAKEKYWIETVGQVVESAVSRPGKSAAVLHPLLHTNTSDLKEQSYSSLFNGEEFFFAQGQTLSTVAYLEMARAAVAQATLRQPESGILELHNVVWGQPFVAADNSAVTVALFASDEGRNELINFEIYSQAKSAMARPEELVHCQGQAVFNRQPAPAKLNLAQLSAQMQQGQFDATNLYQVFAKMGLHYDPAHQGITAIAKGQNQLLAQLSLPAAHQGGARAGANTNDYLLHPGLMDAALQAAIALTEDLTQVSGKAPLPFALQSLRVVFACLKEMVAWVRYSPNTGAANSVAVDIDLCDLQGNICVQLRGLSLQKMVSQQQQTIPKQIVLQQLTPQPLTNYQANVALATPKNNVIAAASVATKPQAIQLMNLQALPAVANINVAAAKPKLALQSNLDEVAIHVPAREQTTLAPLVALQPVNFMDELDAYEVAASEFKADALVDQHSSDMPDVVLSQDQLQQQLRVSLSEALYMKASDIEMDKSFVDLGLDSIVGVEWVKVINKKYGLNISATRVYDYSNIKELAAFLATELEKLPKAEKQATPKPIASLSSVPVATASFATDFVVHESANNQSIVEKAVVLSQDQLQQQLRTSLAEALYMKAADIELDKSFVDLGLDSIVGVEWVKVINKQYSLTISATRVYDYSNIKELSAFLVTELEKLPAASRQQTSAKEIISAKPVIALTPEYAVAETPAPYTSQNKSPVSLISSYPVLTRRARVNRTVDQTAKNNALSLVNNTLPAPNNSAAAQTGYAPSLEKIAIIGMSGKYPQANNLQEYWENLLEGKNSITEIPKSRWDVNQYYDPDPTQKDKIYCKWLGVMDDVDCFDPLFFQISPAEAESMDPQHRLFMQESYKAFEDAGYSNKTLSNKKCGVYLGIMSAEYSLLLTQNTAGAVDTTGNSYAIGAARIAYYLNLKGPAIPIDTACSSSLVAIHLACQGLLNREIDMGLAGGVSLYLLPETYLGMCRAGMLSPEGQCKTFDNAANGFVPGEGVGAVVLKRLQDAQQDNDFIYGVILGSGINQDGKTNGITAPSVNSQIELEREIYAKYNIDPATISYVETHGTGTKLGDPIELEALATVFSEKTAKKNYCGLGSVKSNVGHISGAAGVASVQKVLLSMQHKTLVPSLNVTKENILFDFENSPFYISKEQHAWDVAPNSLRRASVSAFGFSGTNAHLVLEEYRAPVQDKRIISAAAPNAEVAIILSARSGQQLHQKAHDLLGFIRKEKQAAKIIDLAAMAYTLQLGREAMKERLGFVVNSIAQLEEKLQAYIAAEGDHSLIEGVYLGQVARDKDTLSMFSADSDLRETLDKWIAQKKLSKLLELWVKGLELDWNKFYDTKPQRMNLPTYPFAKERYWVSSSPVNQKTAREIKTEVAELVEEKQKLYYYPQWKPKALVAVTEKIVMTGPILIVDATDELFLNIKTQLVETGVEESAIVSVKFGDTYQEITPNIISINPAQEEHFSQLVEHLKIQGKLPQQIIHHCLASANGEKFDKLSDQLNRGVYTLFNLCKALMNQKHQVPLKILSVCTNNTSSTAPQYAALGAFFKTLSLENPIYLAKVLEIQNVPGISELSIAEQASLMLNEFQDKHWNTTEIRYQPKVQNETSSWTRYVKELVAYNPAERQMAELPLKQNGVYIITGGLGGLGFIFSEYLVKNFSAKLVLLGRSVLKAEQEEKLNQLKTYHKDVIYLQADVANLADVQSVVQKTKAHFSAINGVIHSAGVNRDAFIIKKTKAEMSEVLNPKVYGAIYLDEATRNENLDLFVLFSSGAGVMGNVGQCDYAYANHFLDAFAANREDLRKQQKRSGKALSINWPFWSQGGMAVSQNYLALTEKRTGLCALSTADGIQYWEEFLRSDLSQGIALYGTPSKIKAYIAQVPVVANRPQLAPTKVIDSTLLLEKTETYLKGLVSEETKLAAEQIDSQERFESFGFDSIMIGRFNANLGRDLGVLPKTLLYEYETIVELAQYLTQEAQPALSLLFNLEDSVKDVAIQLGDNQTVSTVTENIQPISFADKRKDDIEQIAIIGVHGYYPQSGDLDAYWENLKQGKDLIDVVPENRWDFAEFYDADPEKSAEGKIYCKWGGFLDDFDKFDPAFFNISPEEAKIIDPQERMFLESVWAAIEDAGYTRESLKHQFPKAKSADVGVFVGVTTNSYQLLATEEWNRGNMVSPSAMPWSIANRVSYFFDFQGPSMPIDTACSSSLVAIHIACESLRKEECQVAVAGGVNLYLHPAKYQSFCTRRMLSLGGKCRSFGAGDDGFVPGEGVGTVLLKPLSKAIEDKDHIYAVVAASAFEHCGRSNGYSAPNPNSQASLIAHTLKKGKIHPETIGYIEGHGTGTQLGDNLEIVALTQAFQQQTAKKQFCPVGSVKANIGHSESAAGMAGIAKILLQIKHQQLVPTIYSDEVNPNIEFADSPFYLQHTLTPWMSSPIYPRRALINSFGAGGVNACVILEEYEKLNLVEDSQPDAKQIAGAYLFVLSAKNEQRLHEYANRLLSYLEKEEQVNLANLAYTLQVGREAMQERLAIVVADTKELVSQLTRWSQSKYIGATTYDHNVYRGSLDPRRGLKKTATKNNEVLFNDIFTSQNLNELATMWIAGESVDWERLYPQNSPLRIALPTYPFAKERYWVSDSLIPEKRVQARQYLAKEEQQIAQLHPLVSYNSSTLKQVSFSSLLSDKEFYARDHQVNNEMIFPGAGFMEIACIAGNIAGEERVAKIKDIVWIQPLSFKNGVQTVKTFLKPIGNSTEYEISSLDEENDRVVHSEGRLFFQNHDTHALATEKAVPIQTLKEQCGKPQAGAQYYKNFQKFGFNYGPAFQTIEEFYVSESFALSRLKLADYLKADFEQFILHPSIIDGALQTVVGLIGRVESEVPYLPFALDEVDIIRPISEVCYAYVEFADPEQKMQADIKKFNIQILNEHGDVLVKLKNFYVRAFGKVKTRQQDGILGII
ncbi:MAG: SDR family NAD(P)-dependent oxidoreductase [Pseudomonadota bacterium]